MKYVVIQRAWSDHRATLGMLTVIGEDHVPIFTLENPLRETFVDSCIPDGEYECVPYSGTHHKDVYLIKNVPERTDILFHAGNTEADTKGCILLGMTLSSANGIPRLDGSKIALEKFRLMIGNEGFILKLVAEVTQC